MHCQHWLRDLSERSEHLNMLWNVQVGPAAILDSIVDPEFIDTRNR